MIDSSKQHKNSRRRGVILTYHGLKRLQTAIEEVAIADNQGEHLSLEDLSLRTNVSTKTLSRLWSLNVGVDRKTLQLCFSTLNLELTQDDYTVIDESPQINFLKDLSVPSEPITPEQHEQLEDFGPYPNGPVPLDSPFYIKRPPIEELVNREIIQPGCVIRIRAPKEMGKSSLVLRLLAFADNQEYSKVCFNCNQIDAFCLNDLNKLLRCLCKRIAQELGLDSNLDDYWDEEIGCKLSCSFYLHNLLKQNHHPVILVLNEVDRFFEHPQIAQEFFALLRSWHEEARQDSDWQKLRLVVVYSTEEYVNLDINRSPFNVGLPLKLDEFNEQQVEELARRHGLDWNKKDEVTQLMSLVGGHPALIRIALYCLCCQGMILGDLIQEALTDGGVYRYHLWRHWMTLQDNPNLIKILVELLTTDHCLFLPPLEAYKLESMGLIDYDGHYYKLRCELYRTYFKKQLSLGVGTNSFTPAHIPM